MVISRFPALFGKYILLDRVNSGGMAEVFRAKSMGAEQFQRLVAIKCMLPQLIADEHFTAMFIDEAKLAAQLNHANIVQIYELGRLKERLYIAMELVNGHDLRHIVQRAQSLGVPIPRGFAAYVLSKAASGLDFAHRRAGINGAPLNLVHRDVSPQNILVSYDGEVKMVDFGIAKAEARAAETQVGVLKGKFAYMAPEQIMGEPVDRRVDIFALGSVLFETLTGQRLFNGDTDIALLENVRAARLPDLAALLPPGSEGMIRILEHTVTRSPQDRYSYASEFADELEVMLVEDGQIFGYKRAAQFMAQLYAEEMAQQLEAHRTYAGITVEQCVATLGEAADLDGQPLIPPAQATVALSGPPQAVSDQLTQAIAPAAVPAPAAADGAAAPPPADAASGGARTTTRKYLVQPGEDPYTVMFQPNKGGRAKRGNTNVSSLRLAPSLHRSGQNTSESENPLLRRRGRRLASLAASLMVALLVCAWQLLGRIPPPTQLRAEAPASFSAVPTPTPTPGGPTVTPIAPPAKVDPIGALAPKGAGGYLQLRAALRNRGQVSIDGHDLGLLPLPLLKVAYGRHIIEVTEEGQQTRRKSVVVGHQHSRRVPCLIDF